MAAILASETECDGNERSRLDSAGQFGSELSCCARDDLGSGFVQTPVRPQMRVVEMP